MNEPSQSTAEKTDDEKSKTPRNFEDNIVLSYLIKLVPKPLRVFCM